MRRGKRYSSGPLQLVASPGTSAAPRFAFVVSTSVDKRATKRNRMKRLLRESVQKKLEEVGPIDGVFVVRQKFPDTQQEVDTLVAELLASQGLTLRGR